MDPAADPGLSILVVEDEPKLASLLQRALREHGHEVLVVGRGDEAVRVASAQAFDAIVLDVMLPGLGGLEVCRRLRERGVESSIVMLTARGSVDDRIAGLDAGADDYLAKPFALRELYARLRAVRRRTTGTVADQATPAPAPAFEASGILLLPEQHACQRDGVVIDLRRKEYAILELLLRRAGQIVTRADILEAAWDGELDHRSNVIDAQLKRLREKVDAPFGRQSIETVRGVGIRIRREGP